MEVLERCGDARGYEAWRYIGEIGNSRDSPSAICTLAHQIAIKASTTTQWNDNRCRTIFPNLCHSSDKEATLESARIAIGLLDGSQIETVLLTKSGIQQKSPAPILFKGRRESFDIEALPWLRWLVPSDPRARHRLTVAST